MSIRMQKAIENVKSLLGEKSSILAQRWFEWADKINRSNRVFQRIASAKDKEQIADSLAEIRYALIFAGLGFDVEFEPTGNRGPDLGIKRDDEEVVVEVMRLRKTNSELPLLNLDDENFTLPEYGNVLQDTQKVSGKILKKFRQIENKKGIIAIWNNDHVLDEIEPEFAVNWLVSDIKSGLMKMPNRLLFVLYGSPWQSSGNKQLYCSSFQVLNKPFEDWKVELEQTTVFDCIESALLNRKLTYAS